MRQTRLKRGTEGMRLQALALSAIGGVVSLAPSAAHAQAVPEIGTEREWTVGASGEVYYDTNTSRTEDDFAVVRGIKQEDYVFTPSLTASIMQPFGRQAVFLKGNVGYTFHRYNPNLDRRRINVTGGVGSILGPCRPAAYATYDANQSDLADLDLGTTENLRETTTVAVAVACAPSAGLGGSVLVQRADSKNSADSVKNSDATIKTATVSMGYSQPSIGTVSLGFSHTDTEYPNRIIPGRPVGDGFFTQAYFLSYNRQFGSKLSVGANIGRIHLKREFAPPGSEQSLSSTSYGLDVVYGLGRRIDLELHAARSVTPSKQVGKSYDQQTSAEGAIVYRLGTRVTLTGGYIWRDTESNTDTASSLLVVNSSRVDTVYGTITFVPNDRMSFSLNVRHEEREANPTQFTYSGLRIGLSAQTAF
ncbi:MAG: hypothetical protein ACOY5Y_12430 [Pseudomonadota bacterium]